MSLILASQSPRRRELLGLTGLDFTIRVADIDETMDLSKAPYDEVARVSRLKALAVARKPEDVVVAADTIVVCDHQVMGKPRNEADAFRMLSALSGGVHRVWSGVCVRAGERILTEAECTEVCFRTLAEEEIRAYIATGEPMDKAGSYGYQGLASVFVESIRGDYFNVVGLPLCRLGQMLKEFGVELL